MSRGYPRYPGEPAPGEPAGEGETLSRLTLMLASPAFLIPALLLIVAAGIGYSFYWWPPAGNIVGRVPGPVGDRRLHLASLADLSGRVERLAAGTRDWKPAPKLAPLGEGDRLRLEEGARVRLVFPGALTVRALGKAYLRFEVWGLFLDYGTVLVEGQRVTTTTKVQTPLLTCATKASRYVLAQEVGGKATLSVLGGQVPTATGPRRHTVTLNQQVECERLGSLSRPRAMTAKEQTARLHPFSSS